MHCYCGQQIRMEVSSTFSPISSLSFPWDGEEGSLLPLVSTLSYNAHHTRHWLSVNQAWMMRRKHPWAWKDIQGRKFKGSGAVMQVTKAVWGAIGRIEWTELREQGNEQEVKLSNFPPSPTDWVQGCCRWSFSKNRCHWVDPGGSFCFSFLRDMFPSRVVQLCKRTVYLRVVGLYGPHTYIVHT